MQAGSQISPFRTQFEVRLQSICSFLQAGVDLQAALAQAEGGRARGAGAPDGKRPTRRKRVKTPLDVQVCTTMRL